MGFKKRRVLPAIFTAVAILFLTVYFQNCAPPGSTSLVLDGGSHGGGNPTPGPVDSTAFVTVTSANVPRNTFVACPSGYKVSGCTNLCANGAAGGAYPDTIPNGCFGNCNTNVTTTISALCTKTENGRAVTVVKKDNVDRNETVTCPGGMKLMGCSGMCAGAASGGSTIEGGVTCRLDCDSAGVGGTISAFCLVDPSNTVTLDLGTQSGVPSGTTRTCPGSYKVVGHARNCQNGRAGGESVTGDSLTNTCLTGETSTVTLVCGRASGASN